MYVLYTYIETQTNVKSRKRIVNVACLNIINMIDVELDVLWEEEEEEDGEGDDYRPSCIYNVVHAFLN